VNSISFIGIENLSGGSKADTFILTSSEMPSGLLTGGLGSDTLVGADTVNAFDITGADSGIVNGLFFFSIENLFGGSMDDIFVFTVFGSLGVAIMGGLGMDRVRGANKKNTWRITGVGRATLNSQSLSDVERLEGGSEEDEFVFKDGADFAGAIDGGVGINSLDYSAYTADVTVDLSAGMATGLIVPGT
jgi:hypothetical protein